MIDNNSNFFQRFYLYQKERFPFLAHGLLIAAFSFSAISYSRLCRGLDSFIPSANYLHCIAITITLFFLVRIFDEFKDKEDDAKYRTYLPVPRGLMKLKELGIIGVCTFAFQILLLLFFQRVLWVTYAPVIIYLCLMGREFFIASWLKERQFWYVVSHMFIIPLVDIYASSYDWKLHEVTPPIGLVFFFLVSYFNGIVLEIGRKIKTPETEEHGVKSYTFLLGTRKAILVWIAVLTITLFSAFAAWFYAANTWPIYAMLFVVYLISLIPAILFYRNIKSAKLAKSVEIISAVWTIAMYLCLGGGPMVFKQIF
jgi:hypothetical protein